MKLIDLTGQKFGKLTVVERAGNTNHGAAKWCCVCECGNETVVIGDELRKGNTRSCGCLRKKKASVKANNPVSKNKKHVKANNPVSKNKKHGKAGTPFYKEWIQIKQRCYNPNDSSYKNYGGRGISVCDKWRNSFESFEEDVSKLPHFGEIGYSLNA